jgi:hypothetical protein
LRQVYDLTSRPNAVAGDFLADKLRPHWRDPVALTPGRSQQSLKAESEPRKNFMRIPTVRHCNTLAESECLQILLWTEISNQAIFRGAAIMQAWDRASQRPIALLHLLRIQIHLLAHLPELGTHLRLPQSFGGQAILDHARNPSPTARAGQPVTS